MSGSASSGDAMSGMSGMPGMSGGSSSGGASPADMAAMMAGINPYDSPVGIAWARPGAIMAAAVVFPIVCSFILFLRFTARCRLSKSSRSDAGLWFMAAACILLVGMGAVLGSGVAQQAVGYPTPAPSKPDLMTILTETSPQTTTLQKVQYIFQLLMIACYFCVKMSVIFFYRNVFVLTNRSIFHWVTVAAGVIVTIWWLAYTFAIAFDCGVNFSAHWTALINLIQNCSDLQNVVLSLLITDLLTDILVLVLPIPILLGLQMSTSKKLGTVGIFSLGLLATIASAIRLAIYVNAKNLGVDPRLDQNLSVATILYWSMIEAGVSIIAISLPTITSLFTGQGMATKMRSFVGIFTLRSKGSTSRSRETQDRGASHQRSTAAARKGSRSTSEGDFELLDRGQNDTPLPQHGGITVTRNIQVETA